jgi:hypothetical protein
VLRLQAYDTASESHPMRPRIEMAIPSNVGRLEPEFPDAERLGGGDPISVNPMCGCLTFELKEVSGRRIKYLRNHPRTSKSHECFYVGWFSLVSPGWSRLWADLVP